MRVDEMVDPDLPTISTDDKMQMSFEYLNHARRQDSCSDCSGRGTGSPVAGARRDQRRGAATD
jgi:hypothetical protein